MIVPDFKLKQDERYLCVFIRLPYIKVSACEFYIDSSTFKFYLKPYLLSLSFEQRLKVAQQPAKAVYYHEKYVLQVHLEKQIPGETFTNLDLISNINNKKKEKKCHRVSIEVIGATPNVIEETQQTSSQLKFNQYNYGFCMQYSNVFDNLQEQTVQLFAFNPKDTPISQRFPLSKDIIANDFDIDSFLFDKYDNQDEISSVLKDKSFIEYLQGLHQKEEGPQISSEEFRIKMKITKKELLLPAASIPAIKREILSIIFAYLYELICMGGEIGPESAKTINQTSLVLHCNATFGEMTLKEMLVDCYRRCMTYSLYKSLKMCAYVQRMLTKYLNKSYIKVILEDLRRLFEKNQPRYLLNRIYIDDYLLYIYSLKGEEEFNQFYKESEQCNISENDLGLGIEEYEKEQANQSYDEEEQEQIGKGELSKEQVELRKEEKKLIQEIQRLQTLD